MFKPNNDKYAGILAAKGLATPIVKEQTVIPEPLVTAEQQLATETTEYLKNLKPPEKRPDAELNEDAEGEDEDDEK